MLHAALQNDCLAVIERNAVVLLGNRDPLAMDRLFSCIHRYRHLQRRKHTHLLRADFDVELIKAHHLHKVHRISNQM
jgi:hypothetical protein